MFASIAAMVPIPLKSGAGKSFQRAYWSFMCYLPAILMLYCLLLPVALAACDLQKAAYDICKSTVSTRGPLTDYQCSRFKLPYDDCRREVEQLSTAPSQDFQQPDRSRLVLDALQQCGDEALKLAPAGVRGLGTIARETVQSLCCHPNFRLDGAIQAFRNVCVNPILKIAATSKQVELSHLSVIPPTTVHGMDATCIQGSHEIRCFPSPWEGRAIQVFADDGPSFTSWFTTHLDKFVKAGIFTPVEDDQGAYDFHNDA